jgi:hypothetical protein
VFAEIAFALALIFDKIILIMKYVYFFCASMLSFLTACSSVDGVPNPVSFTSNPQYKLKSVTHWKLIAQDVASQVAEQITVEDKVRTPIFLKLPVEPTTFERNFMPMLRAALMKEGFIVSSQSQGAAELQIQVDKVAHAPVYRSGTLVLLGAGLLAMRDAAIHNAYQLTPGGGMAVAVLADQSMQTKYAAPPDLELTLNVSVTQAGQYIFAQTQVYYLASEDRMVYENLPQPVPQNRPFSVIGGK